MATTTMQSPPNPTHLHSGTSSGGNHLQNSNNQRYNSSDPRQRLLQLPTQPVGQTFPLRAVLALLQHPVEGETVYLMSPDYVQNWLTWALHQPLGCGSKDDNSAATSPLVEAVRMAALQYHLPLPHDGMDYDDPGPMDNTALSVQGHALLLNPMAELLDLEHTHYSLALLRLHSDYALHSNNTHHHHHLQHHSETEEEDDEDEDDDDVVMGGSMRNMTNRRNRYHSASPSRRHAVMKDNSERPIKDSKHNDNNSTTTNLVVHCVAVPETFYELIRRLQGVRCDDFRTVSFQPYTDEDDALAENHNHASACILYHHRYQHGSQSHNQDHFKHTPRPVEFRRKIVRQVTPQQPQHNSSNHPPHPLPQEYPLLNKKEINSKKVTSSGTLMEKLLLEEHIAPPTQLVVEVHPIKLIYRTVRDDESHVATAANPSGFVLVSRATPAYQAVQALQRVAEPRRSTEQVRTWSQYEYALHSPPQQHQSPTVQPTANVQNDGYELVDVMYWLQRELPNGDETIANGEGCYTTTGDWVDRHYPPNTATIAPTPLGTHHDSNNYYSHGHNRRNHELQLLLETRRSDQTAWPRQNLELAHRLQVGDWIDAQDVAGHWYEARVVEVWDQTVKVHYVGWARRWDAVLPRFPQSQQQSPLETEKYMAANGNNSKTFNNGNDNNEGPYAKVQPPAPLWSRSTRWRGCLTVGDTVEVRDSGSLVERPKWYRGVVRHVLEPNARPRPMSGGAALELYSDSGNGDAPVNAILRPLLIMNQTQQVLVEVEQERHGNNVNSSNNDPHMMSSIGSGSTIPHQNLQRNSKATVIALNQSMDSLDTHTLQAQPPVIRWVYLFGEEICRTGTHLKGTSSAVVTLHYEFDANRKPVEVMKSHPMHGSGFMREALRGTPPAPGSVGLHNLGNSCFLNSTVQCLNHIEPLTQYFLQEKYAKDLNKRNPLGSGGNVAIAYASLLKKMWNGQYSVLVPRLLKQTVASFAPQFDNSYQHDSHEFCQFLMDGLHEDLNRVKTKPYVEELEGFGMKDEIAALESWRKHLLRHDSVIVDNCQGMHRSHLTCPQCGRESIKFDVYSSISLPLPQDKATVTNKAKNNSSGPPIKLEDCMEKFMEAEQLDERDAYYCPSCRRHVCALKLIALWTVPDILILHLKRFTFDTCMLSGGMLRSKIDTTVEFPINGLDLTKEVLGPIDPDAPPIYNLFGVSEHTGPTANSGHYTATVRNSIDNQWYRCNDGHVGRTSGEASITGGAYLLFYKRAKGTCRWGGLYKFMKERGIDPYDGMNPIVAADKDNFVPVVKNNSKKNKNSNNQRNGPRR